VEIEGLKSSSLFDRVLLGILSVRESGIILAVIVLTVAFTSMNVVFISFGFMMVILSFAARVGIIAAGMTLLMGSREFDLSVGSVFALAPIIAYDLADLGVSIWIGVVLGIALCALCGLFNYYVAVRLRISSLITTLGTMFFFRTIDLVLTSGGARIPPLQEGAFSWIFGNGLVYGVPTAVFWWLGITFACMLLLGKTKHGNWTLAVGGNVDAAKALGVNSDRVKMKNFVLTAVLAGLSGLIYCTRSGAVYAVYGAGLELTVVGAVAIGGTSLLGGSATVLGTAIASILLGMVYLGLITVLPSTTQVPAMYFYEGGVGVIIIGMSILNMTLDKVRAQRRIA